MRTIGLTFPQEKPKPQPKPTPAAEQETAPKRKTRATKGE